MSQASTQSRPTKLPKHINYNGKFILLKYHMMLTGSGKHPGNSLAALQEVIDGEVAVIEFDVNYLADNEFGFIHDGTLQRETTGLGEVRKLDGAAFKALSYKHSSEPLCTLSDATKLLKSINFPVKLQVDFKEKTPIDDAQATVFLKAIESLRENDNITIVVGCLADWNLRTLRRLDDELNIGVDFAFHLDVPTADELVRLPTRVGAYGYLDDHMLAARKLQSPESYLRDRTEVLLNLVPNAYEFYLHKDFVARAIQDGFNPVEFTHTYLPDSFVDVWTIDYSSGDHNSASEAMFQVALDAGADQITTNTALQWAEVYS